jgi:hypothetical protein
VNRGMGCKSVLVFFAALIVGLTGIGMFIAGSRSGLMALSASRVDNSVYWNGLFAMLIFVLVGVVAVGAAWHAVADTLHELQKPKPGVIEGEIPDAEADYTVGDDGELILLDDDRERHKHG